MVTAKVLTGWDEVLNTARTTVGLEESGKEPSIQFKKLLLVSEHSPLRSLLFKITFDDIPYWVAMHLRTHHIGFKSSDDELYFIETQRSDRTQEDRDHLTQSAPVKMSITINAQALINVSRVRLCTKASRETRMAWQEAIDAVRQVEPLVALYCVPNCIYRGLCPEKDGCKYIQVGRSTYETNCSLN